MAKNPLLGLADELEGKDPPKDPPGLLASIRESGGALAELLAGAGGLVGSPAVRFLPTARGAADITAAQLGDQEAQARVGGRELAVGTIASLVPGGRAASRISNLARGAILGGAGAGAEAAAGGRDVPSSVLRGAAIGGPLGALLGPVARRVVPEGSPKTAAGRLMQVIRRAPSIRGRQEALRTVKRIEKIKSAKRAGRGLAGEAQLRAEKSQLAGKLPSLRIAFEDIRRQISDDDVIELMSQIRDHPGLRYFETVKARDALSDLLRGGLPTKSDEELLRVVFGNELIEAILSKRTTLQKASDMGIELFNVSRALRASFDLSAPLRQGVFFIGKPKEFGTSFAKMLRVAFNPKEFARQQEEIASRATAPLMRTAGVEFTTVGGRLGKREEPFIGQLAEKIPILGAGVRAADRAFVGFLNQLRADVFDSIIKNHARNGGNVNDRLMLKSLGNYVNEGTGRGKIFGKKFERAAPALAGVFFSPRLQASRVRILTNPVNPSWWVNTHPAIRKDFFKTAASDAAIALSLLAIAKGAGALVSDDIRNSDFGKIRIGNTRFDILGGFQQYIRLGGQLIAGESVSPISGRVSKFGERFGGPTRLSKVQDFVISKFAPIPGMVAELARGRDFEGNDISVPKETLELVTPFIISDATEAMEEWGTEVGLAMATPAVFGVGMQTFGRSEAKNPLLDIADQLEAEAEPDVLRQQ